MSNISCEQGDPGLISSNEGFPETEAQLEQVAQSLGSPTPKRSLSRSVIGPAMQLLPDDNVLLQTRTAYSLGAADDLYTAAQT